MSDDDHEDLDALTRAELAELDGPASTVATVLDEWNHRLHGLTSSSHGAGLFLDLLAAEGWRVTPINAPDLDGLLAAPRPMASVEFPPDTTDEEIIRFRVAWTEAGGGPLQLKREGDQRPFTGVQVPSEPVRVTYLAGVSEEELERARQAVLESATAVLREQQAASDD
jgi:hypothetical protein